MIATRFAARTRARRPLVHALAACALSLGIPLAAHAAPLTPEQTVDLYLGAFINGDVSKAVQFNEAMRTRFDGKDAIDVAAVSKMGDTLRDNIVAVFLSKVPTKVRATLRAPVNAAVTSYQHALTRSECKATGSTQKPNEYVEGESIATVEFSCRVADVEPGVKALREKLGNPRLKSDKARAAFLASFFTGTVPVFDNAPVSRPMTGQIDLYGTDEKGWITGSPGDVLPPIVDALLGPVGGADDAADK